MLQRPMASIRRKAETIAITSGVFQRRPPRLSAGGMYQSGSGAAEAGQVDPDRHRIIGQGGAAGRRPARARSVPRRSALSSGSNHHLSHPGEATFCATGSERTPGRWPDGRGAGWAGCHVRWRGATWVGTRRGPARRIRAGIRRRTNPNDQAYWDGRRWSRQPALEREWMGRGGGGTRRRSWRAPETLGPPSLGQSLRPRRRSRDRGPPPATFNLGVLLLMASGITLMYGSVGSWVR